MCLVAIVILALGGLCGAGSSLFAYRARTLRTPAPSVWGVYLDGPTGYTGGGLQIRKLALILAVLGFAALLTFFVLVMTGATCWEAS